LLYQVLPVWVKFGLEVNNNLCFPWFFMNKQNKSAPSAQSYEKGGSSLSASNPNQSADSGGLSYRLPGLPRDLEPIRQHWEQRGRKYGLSASASWVDETMLNHEGLILANYIKDDDMVLDAGCANGYTTLQLARLRRIRITGVDYAPSMIEHANLNLSRAGRTKGAAFFKISNFLKLDFADNIFDKVISKRTMINLGTHAHQRTALLEAYRVLRPGGLFLLSEVSIQSAVNLNRLRTQSPKVVQRKKGEEN
jgi:ubiquinone/menaquinone biosynthesis C-methylase UbiE